MCESAYMCTCVKIKLWVNKSAYDYVCLCSYVHFNAFMYGEKEKMGRWRGSYC